MSDVGAIVRTESALLGKARVEGQIVDLNYPGLRAEVTIALDNSAAKVHRISGFWPFNNLVLNDQYYVDGHEGAQRQLAVDYYYMHYRSWQHDRDDAYWDARANSSFFDYLALLAQGDKGEHSFWVIDQKGKIYSTTQVEVAPSTQFVLVLISPEHVVGGAYRLDPTYYDYTKAAMIATRAIGVSTSDVPPGEEDTPRNRAWLHGEGYGTYLASLQNMAYPSAVQKLGSSPKDFQQVRKAGDDLMRIYLGLTEDDSTCPIISKTGAFQ